MREYEEPSAAKAEIPIAEVPRGAELRRVLAAICNDVNQLEQAINSLPAVDKNGGSECPFAAELYARKEALEEKVSHWVEELNRFLGFLENEIKRCKKNLETIGADASRLHLTETKQEYANAEFEQLSQYRSAVQDRDAVYITLMKARAVLKVSRTRKFPGGAPSVNDGAFGTNSPERGVSSQGNLGSEVEGLLSLGPGDPKKDGK